MTLRLKKIKEDEIYDINCCAAIKCGQLTTIIVSLEGQKQYGLCQKHWLKYCED